MSSPGRNHGAIREQWTPRERAEHYRRGRFRSRRAEERDPRAVASLLGRFNVTGPVLDAPCGTGRLRPAIERGCESYVGVDASLAMLREAAEPSRLITADALRLPFRAASFEAVVACRLLHHLGEASERRAILSELARVSSRLVIASFWDAASWHALRRRLGWRKDTSTRRSISKVQLERELESSGLRVLTWKHSLRYVSQQTFFVAEKR